MKARQERTNQRKTASQRALKALTGEANNIDVLVDICRGRHGYQAACEQPVLQVDVL